MSLNPAAHPHVYGPRTGDRIRLGDTGLTIEVEAHSQPADDEFLLGFGKSGRDGIALRAVPTSESCDVVISNVLIIDPILGIRSASIGTRACARSSLATREAISPCYGRYLAKAPLSPPRERHRRSSDNRSHRD